MKQQFRKILSLTTAAALTLGMVVTAHAADSGMTRGEMAKLLVEGAGLSGQAAEYAAKTSAFRDVAEGSAYEGYINLAYAKGLMSGTGGGSFRPDAKTTQLEAAAAVMQYAGVPDEMLKSWPADYEDTAVRVGLTAGGWRDPGPVPDHAEERRCPHWQALYRHQLEEQYTEL